MAALATEATHLCQGGLSPTDPNVSTLILPPGFGPGELALALGPGRQWWERGLIALRLGSWLAWLPIAYFVYVLVLAQSRPLVAAPIPFTGISFITALANEAAFWLVAAFAFGCLFPYLRGRNGLVKGAALGLVYLAAHAGASLLGATGDTLWQVRSVQLLLFLMVLGVLMDGATVEGAALSWQYLVERYKVAEAKAALTYATSLIGLVVLLGKQLATGEAAQAVTAIAAGQQQIGLLLSMAAAVSP